MAVQPQTPYKEYTANGSTESFALEFDCDNQGHLIVLVDGMEPVVGTWSLSGGAVVFGTTPASGKKITIQRNTPFRRDGDFQSYDNSFRPGPVNKGFDWVWLKLQELGVADWILSNRIDSLKNYVNQQDSILQDNIDSLKNYVDDKDDELRNYLLNAIQEQGVALDQLEEYYSYLMQQLAQVAIDRGWAASFIVSANGSTQQEINDFGGAEWRDKPLGYKLGATVKLTNGDIVKSTVANNIIDPNFDMTGWQQPETVNSVDQLRATKPSYKGQKLQLLSYHSGLGAGGGEVIATQKQGLLDNGITIFSSGVPNMFWIRTNYAELVVDMAGAKGDGVADDTTAIINAFKVGGKITSKPEYTHFISRAIVSSNPAVTAILPNSFKSIDSTPIDFDGKGCKFKTDGFINKTAPVSIAPIITVSWGDELKGAGIFIDNLPRTKLRNYKLTGSLFDNVLEDTKPYIEGAQGTYGKYNTYLCGVFLHRCNGFDISDFETNKAYTGLRLAGCLGGSVTNVTAQYTERGLYYTACAGIKTTKCVSDEARYSLARTNFGTTNNEVPVVDESGAVIYTVMPGATGKDGVKAASGIGFLDCGGDGNIYTECTSIYANSNCFRVQHFEDGAARIGAKNVSWIDCTSDYGTRHAFSIYGLTENVVNVIRPVVKHHGELKRIITPPATRAECLLGCTDGDIVNYWSFNIAAPEQKLGFLSSFAGMYIKDIDYSTSKSVQTGFGRYAHHTPTNMTRRIFQSAPTAAPEWTGSYNFNIDGGKIYSAIYSTGQEVWIPTPNSDGSPCLRNCDVKFDFKKIGAATRVRLITPPNPQVAQPVYFENVNLSLDGDGHNISILRCPSTFTPNAALDFKFKNVNVTTVNTPSFYLLTSDKLDVSNVSILLEDCDMPKNTDILTLESAKTAQVLNIRPKRLLATSSNVSAKKDTIRKIYNIDGTGRLQVRTYLTSAFNTSFWIPKRAKLIALRPISNVLNSYTADIPNDNLSVLKNYLYPLPTSTAIAKVYSASGVEGNISMQMEQETTTEIYVTLTSTNIVAGYYLFEFENFEDFDYIAAINNGK